MERKVKGKGKGQGQGRDKGKTIAENRLVHGWGCS